MVPAAALQLRHRGFDPGVQEGGEIHHLASNSALCEG